MRPRRPGRGDGRYEDDMRGRSCYLPVLRVGASDGGDYVSVAYVGGGGGDCGQAAVGHAEDDCATGGFDRGGAGGSGRDDGPDGR